MNDANVDKTNGYADSSAAHGMYEESALAQVSTRGARSPYNACGLGHTCLFAIYGTIALCVINARGGGPLWAGALGVVGGLAAAWIDLRARRRRYWWVVALVRTAVTWLGVLALVKVLLAGTRLFPEVPFGRVSVTETLSVMLQLGFYLALAVLCQVRSWSLAIRRRQAR